MNQNYAKTTFFKQKKINRLFVRRLYISMGDLTPLVSTLNIKTFLFTQSSIKCPF
jgi:hypothetical protein